MEIDLAQLDSHQDVTAAAFRAEICIVGAGIAGLTLAHKLVQLGHDVLLLEAGGGSDDAQAATVRDIVQAGEPHPGSVEGRVRAVGGTSLTWGGQLLPLPDDAAWPVSAGELSAYNAEAERLLAVDDLPYRAEEFFAQLGEPGPGILRDVPQLEPSISKFAPFSHRNLARTLGTALGAHAKARILLHARATEIVPAPSGDHVEAVVVRGAGGRTVRVQAAQVVIAAGTIETVRLLLASRSVASEGVGNQHDQVGRNFHDHLTVTAATVHGSARERLLSEMRPWISGGTVHSVKLSASRELRDLLELTPVMAHMTLDEPDASGIGALRAMLRGRQHGRFRQAFAEVLPQLPLAARDLGRLTWSARVQHRRYVSPQAKVLLRLNAAQVTPSGSRITLSDEADSLGQSKAMLDWRVNGRELNTLRSFTGHLRDQLAGTCSSGIEWSSALLEATDDCAIPKFDDARHAMGGACMGTDPRTSVVTPELRVHGVRNLFVASAATFPDGSPQLPTLPLMALTLRLADLLHGLR